jgi:hypothetical protein
MVSQARTLLDEPKAHLLLSDSASLASDYHIVHGWRAQMLFPVRLLLLDPLGTPSTVTSQENLFTFLILLVGMPKVREET